MPPEIVPSATMASICAALNRVTSWPAPSSTPLMLVSMSSFSACKAVAMRAATTSALML